MKCPQCGGTDWECARCGADIADAYKAEGKRGGAIGGKASGDCKRRSPEHYQRVSKIMTKARIKKALARKRARRAALRGK